VSGSEFRVFYGHRKGAEGYRDEMARATQLLAEALGDAYAFVTVTSGEDDWREHFHNAGGWDAWTGRVAFGRKYGSPEPFYHAIIVPDRVLGKATAGIVQLALQWSKPVLLFEGDQLWRVTRLDIDGRDFRSWASVVVR
jgi:hypothetical protein